MIGTVAPAPGLALYLYTMLKSSYELGAGWYFVISVDEDLIEKFSNAPGDQSYSRVRGTRRGCAYWLDRGGPGVIAVSDMTLSAMLSADGTGNSARRKRNHPVQSHSA